MIQSADEFQIVSNVIRYTRGLKNKPNWIRVRDILLSGTSHGGMGSSISKCVELGVNPDSYEWERESD